jgi:16S rRNA (guanine966-N2)-methyltransferase
MIRITGGRFKGRRIALAAGVGTRPSSGKVREALCSAVGSRWNGRVVVDLFAGAGSLGIEALSRGAARTIFVELDPRAVRVLRSNLEGLGLGVEEALVRRADAWRWLAKLVAGELPSDQRPDVLLADPPYAEGILGRLLSPLFGLVDSGVLVLAAVEHAATLGEIPPAPAGVGLRTRGHGRSAFSLVERVAP